MRSRKKYISPVKSAKQNYPKSNHKVRILSDEFKIRHCTKHHPRPCKTVLNNFLKVKWECRQRNQSILKR